MVSRDHRRDLTLPVPGDTVTVLIEPFEGRNAMVRSVMKDTRTISIAFMPEQLPMSLKETLHIDPSSNTYNYILSHGEYEVILKRRITH